MRHLVSLMPSQSRRTPRELYRTCLPPWDLSVSFRFSQSVSFFPCALQLAHTLSSLTPRMRTLFPLSNTKNGPQGCAASPSEPFKPAFERSLSETSRITG